MQVLPAVALPALVVWRHRSPGDGECQLMRCERCARQIGAVEAQGRIDWAQVLLLELPLAIGAVGGPCVAVYAALWLLADIGG